MGNQCCCQFGEEFSIIAVDEEEIPFPNYSSKFDKIYYYIDVKYNCFVKLTLVQYINLLEHFEISNCTIFFDGPYKTKYSKNDSFLNKTFMEEEFQSFLENYILKIPEILQFFHFDDESIGIFKQAFLNIAKSLQLKLKQSNKNNDMLKKLNLIPLGLLFSKSTNIDKIKLFFDLFKNDNDLFCKSDLLNEYLLSNFLISSYCILKARKDLGNSHGIESIEINDVKKMVQYCELSDCINLVKYFNDNFFDEELISWVKFKNKFENIKKINAKTDSFGWIFSTKGVRHFLEVLDKNNINN